MVIHPPLPGGNIPSGANPAALVAADAVGGISALAQRKLHRAVLGAGAAALAAQAPIPAQNRPGKNGQQTVRRFFGYSIPWHTIWMLR